ncbi:MAG TPA: magnesium/cobalt transporter CorA [Candidatus Peribacterales bacterium]|nr:magnesium/cobalt transporter CorA [Candidatus Peribacterales bacterium]
MESLSHQSLSWHNLITPLPEELNELQKKYGFHELDIEDCLSEHERPKIDEYENYLFFVLHIPYFNDESRRIVKEEIHIFVGANYLITLHDGKLKALNDVWDILHIDAAKREQYMGKDAGYFLYFLIDSFFQSCFPLVDGITKSLRELEGILFEEEREEKVLRTVLELKRNVISMRRILLPQRTLIAALEHKSKRFLEEELEVYFDDVLDAIERQWALLETSKEVINALQESFESWIQNKTNRIIRVLTVFSVTMLPLTVLTGLYGMNVDLPYATNTHAFLIITGFLLIFLIGTLSYFGWKKWL